MCVTVPKFCRNRSNRRRDLAIFRSFQDGCRPPSWIGDACVWTTPMAFGGLCDCAKFGWNRYSSFDNMYSIAFWTLTKTAEPIGMPLLMKTRVGSSNYILRGVQIPQRKGTIIFGSCPGYSKALAIRCRIRCKRDHSIANNVMQQKGSFSTPRKRK